jgi:hypothetical protein
LKKTNDLERWFLLNVDKWFAVQVVSLDDLMERELDGVFRVGSDVVFDLVGYRNSVGRSSNAS